MSQLNLEIKTKLDALQQALLDEHPQIPTLLRDIHTTLKSQPEQVTLMTEEEINIVIQGLEKQTNTYLAAATVKSSRSPSKRAALSNLNDLF
jgi:ribosomal protein L6P/L9E